MEQITALNETVVSYVGQNVAIGFYTIGALLFLKLAGRVSLKKSVVQVCNINNLL